MKLSFIHILLISAILLLFNSGKWGVIETSEARYAEISREMLVNNDYINPKLLDINHYHKPPITYYITVLGYKIFGVGAFSARFFLQIAILIQLILIYNITILLFDDKKIALAAVLIYFSLPLVLISSRNLTTDAYLNTFILTSIYLWIKYNANSKPFLLYFFYLTLGLIFETKGPVGLIFPILFIVIHKIVFKEKFKMNWHHVFGFILFVLIAMSWYLALIASNENILDYFINRQLKDRMISNSFNRSKPFWYYLVTVPLLALPWFIILMVQLKSSFQKIIKEQKMKLVLYVVILVILVLFSAFKTKLILYVLPMFGFIAILSAKMLSDISQKSLTIYNYALIGLGILFLLSLLFLNVVGLDFHFNIVHAIILCITGSVILFLILKHQSGYLKTAFLSYLFGGLLLLGGNGVLAQNEDLLNSTKPATDFIEHELSDIKTIVVYNYLMPSVKFNSNKKVITLNNGHNTVQRETQFETDIKWKDHLIDLKTESGQQQADSILKHESVLISRRREVLPDYLDFLNHAPYQKKVFGKWVIYY